MGKKQSEYYYKYRLTNNHTNEVFEGRGLKTVLGLAGLSTTTPQNQLRKSRKWTVEVIDAPAEWDELTYRKELYRRSKDRYKSYEEAKLIRDPLFEKRKRLRLSGWKNKDGSIFTAEQHNQMLLQCCEVCGSDDTVVDHCHTTLVVRGTLCRKCNLALGHVDDSIERLDNLRSYLMKGRLNE